MHLFNCKIFEEKIQGITEISKLDDGGQKYVFRAKHMKHGNIVLKIVPDGASDERIKREIEVVTEYRLENVPCIYV
jgi:Ser/Thr protein kinase RdoA (MazF antagonist)